MDIVRFLLSLLFPFSSTAQTVEAATPASFSRLLSPRQLTPRIASLLPYRHKVVRAVVREAKFHDSKKAVRLLADVLHDYLLDMERGTQEKLILVPVPLGSARLKERGYNQAERVCRLLPFETNARLVERIRETRPQTSLSRTKRMQNVKEAFVVSGAIDPGAQYVVIDDVTTTGSTMQEVITTLEGAGAAHVEGVALSY